METSSERERGHTKVVLNTLGEEAVIEDVVSRSDPTDPNRPYILSLKHKSQPYLLKGYKLPLNSKLGDTLKILPAIYEQYEGGRTVSRLAPYLMIPLAIEQTVEVGPNDPTSLYLFVEMLYEHKGNSLASLRGKLSFTEVYNLMRQSATALVQLRAAGVKQLDLRPENILYDSATDTLKFWRTIDPTASTSMSDFWPPECLQTATTQKPMQEPMLLKADSYSWAMCFYTLLLNKDSVALQDEITQYKMEESKHASFVANMKTSLEALQPAQSSEAPVKDLAIQLLIAAAEYLPEKRPTMSTTCQEMGSCESKLGLCLPFVTRDAEMKKTLAKNLMLDSLNDEVEKKKLETQIQDCTNTINKLKDTLAQTEARCHAADQKCNDIEDKLKKVGEQHSQELQTAEEAKQKLQTQLKEREQVSVSLTAKVALAEAAIVDAKRQQSEEAKTLEEALRRESQAAKEAEEIKTKLESQRITAEQSISALNNKVTGLESAKLEAEQKHIETVTQLATLQKQQEKVAENHQSEIEKLKAVLAEREQTILSLNTKNAELEAAKAEIDKSLASTTSQLKDALNKHDTELKAADDKQKKMEADIKDHELAKQELNDKLSQLNTAYKEIEQTSQGLLSQLQESQQQNKNTAQDAETAKTALETQLKDREQLETSNTELNKQYVEAKQKLEEDSKGIESIKEKLATLTKEHEQIVAALNTKVVQLENDKAEAAQKQSETAAKVDETALAVQQEQNKANALKSELDKLRKDKEEALSAVNSQVAELTTATRDLERSQAELAQKLQTALKELERASTELAGANAQIEALKGKHEQEVAALKDANTQLANAKSDAASKLTAANATHERELNEGINAKLQLETELATKTKALTDLDKSYKEATTNLADLRAVHQKSVQEAEEVKSKFEALIKEHDSLQAKLSAKTTEVETAHTEAEQKERARLQEFHSELQRVQETMHKKEQELAEIVKSLESLQSKLLIQETQQRETEQKLATATSQIDNITKTQQADMHNILETKAKLEADVKDRDNTIADLTGKNNDLSTQLHASAQQLAETKRSQEQIRALTAELATLKATPPPIEASAAFGSM